MNSFVFSLAVLLAPAIGNEIPCNAQQRQGVEGAMPPRVQVFRAISALLGSEGEEPLREFVKQHVSQRLLEEHGEDRLVQLLHDTRQAYAEALVEGVRAIGSSSAEIVLRNAPKGFPASLRFTLESQPPFHIKQMDLIGAIDLPTNDAEMVAQLEAHLVDLVEEDEFSGAVLVAKNGEVLFQKAYGLASKRYEIPNKVDTKFNLGSMNKMFTGVAICQLVEQGKLAFDDHVGKHVPDYPNRDVAEKVTIHHLLTHTSGLGSYWNDEYEKRWKTIRTVDDFVATFVDDPLSFEPGEQYQYSNAGPVVLGLIIERVTGKSYYDYVRENIYNPSGMAATDCYEMDRPTPNLAIGYTYSGYGDGPDIGPPSDSRARRNNLFLHSIKGGPAGGGFSTVGDLLRFSEALKNHELLGPEMTRTLLAGKVDRVPGLKYGYLFMDQEQAGHRFHGHNGGAPGINGELSFYPDTGYTVAVLANYDGAASPVAAFIRRMIHNMPPSH